MVLSVAVMLRFEETTNYHLCSDNGNTSKLDKLHSPWQEIPQRVINLLKMKKGCIDLVSKFFNEGKDLDFAEKGLEGRCEVAYQFYDGIKQKMNIDANLSFDPTMAPRELGNFNPDNNTIKLNSNYLENPDCKDLLNTLLHESRHAFQHCCVKHPESCDVSPKVIEAWKENQKHYIRPEDDFVAYENQPIEKDANDFADSVMKDGMKQTQYA